MINAFGESDRLELERSLLSEITVGTTHVSYFAQFHVWFVSEPEFDKAGDKRIAHLSFQETEKFPA
ncbi:hypothetical protein [Nostoc sp.]